jgi:hypothetical protein
MAIRRIQLQSRGSRGSRGYHGDTEDTITIQRIQGIQRIPWRYGGYNYNPEDTCRTKSIKRNRVMKIQNLHDRVIRLMTIHFL